MSGFENYSGQAVLVQDDVILAGWVDYKTTYDKVWVDDFGPPIRGLSRWDGTFRPHSVPAALSLDREATLRLPMGCEGRVLLGLTRIDTTSCGSTWAEQMVGFTIEIHGAGTPPV